MGPCCRLRGGLRRKDGVRRQDRPPPAPATSTQMHTHPAAGASTSPLALCLIVSPGQGTLLQSQDLGPRQLARGLRQVPSPPWAFVFSLVGSTVTTAPQVAMELCACFRSALCPKKSWQMHGTQHTVGAQ